MIQLKEIELLLIFIKYIFLNWPCFQIVTYHAGEGGFVADVQYEGTAAVYEPAPRPVYAAAPIAPRPAYVQA